MFAFWQEAHGVNITVFSFSCFFLDGGFDPSPASVNITKVRIFCQIVFASRKSEKL